MNRAKYITRRDLENLILKTVRDVPDFPKEGIVFKDITPVLANPALMEQVVQALSEGVQLYQPDCIAGIEARGFIFGSLVAYYLGIPFVPIRKPGKLPWKTKQQRYILEYGESVIEIHEDAVQANDKVVIVDDLLATGGTTKAACGLISALGGQICAMAFMIELGFLNGREAIGDYAPILSLAKV